MPGFALVFPGQGSQYVGMGRDLYTSSPAARVVFDEANQAWGGELSQLLFEGPAESLTDTANAQPALFVMSMACLAALREAHSTALLVEPAYLAGHSLGEYTALAAAGAFTFGTGLSLVRERGQAMKAAGQAQPGGMAAILGLEAKVVAAACQEASVQTGEPVVIANDNAPGQLVISGAHEAVRVAGELAKARGAKRVVPLAVSIASHSPLMQFAAARFGPVLRQADLTPPRVPVVANRNGRPLVTVDEIIAELDAQLMSPVRWTDSVRYIAEQGVSAFVEVGPKDVLTGLIRRIAPAATCIPCGTANDVERAAQFLREQAGAA